MRRTAAALIAPVAALALLSGCGSSDTAAPAGTTTAAGSASSTPAVEQGTLAVFAAASLKATFTELATQFEAAHPGTTVALTFAGSSDLVTQITEGAPADVFASADTKNMDKAVAAGATAGTPTDFATNTLEIVTAPGNPTGIDSFADLADPANQVVVCAPQVPCGAATASVEQSTGTDITPVSEESSVTDVLNKVTSGEADAGLVYVTDVRTAGSAVTGVPFPESASAVNTYPVAALADSQLPGAAAAFAAFVAGPEGRAVLSAAGFAAP